MNWVKDWQAKEQPDRYPPIRSEIPQIAVAYCKEYFMRLATEAKQEEFHVVLLDEKHNIIKSERITVGLLDKSLVHPREVFKPAIRESASTLILVHNHPSGDPTPSQDDKNITKELKRAAEALVFEFLTTLSYPEIEP